MCNAYRLTVDATATFDGFRAHGMKIALPEGIPNIPPREDVRITDAAPIVRAAAGQTDKAELVQRRWSWPGRNGRPVYNFRSERREFASGRCLIIADGFYEFTGPAEPGKKRKDKWLFTKAGEPWFCIAGLWRTSPEAGEAFTMLTVEPGPDVAPYHDRQVVVLDCAAWAAWLDESLPAASVLKPLPAGSLAVEQVG